jgi:16S rRNA processing protein RimM
VAIGRIRRAHGVRGELCVQPYAAEPSRYASLREVAIGDDVMRVTAVRSHGEDMLLSLEGVSDRKSAEALRGQELFVPASERAPLPDGRYYVDDLVGLAAVDPAGNVLGRVEEVLALPAHDVLRLSTPHGEGLVPMVKAMVLAIDLGSGRIVLDLPLGLLPEAAAGPDRDKPS